jgi:hypothetical protein
MEADGGGQRKRAKSSQERSADYRANNTEMAKLTQLRQAAKVRERRASNPDFDALKRNAEAERKKEYRKRKKMTESNENEDEIENVAPSKSQSLTTQSVRSRQAMTGALERKKTNKEKNDNIESLKNENEELKKENNNLETNLFNMDILNIDLKVDCERKDAKIAELEEKAKTSDSWLNNTYHHMTAAGKREFRNAYQIGASENPKGTTLRIKKNTGINLAKKLTVTNNDESELKVKVKEFADENSTPVPDMRKAKKDIRYRHSYMCVLHDEFKYRNPDTDCSYSQFCAYWPKNVIKPKSGDYGTCKCEKCENIDLKLQALKKHNLIGHEHNMEQILRDNRTEEFGLEESLKDDLKTLLVEPKASTQVKYMEWQKVESTEVNKNTGKQKKATTQRVPKVKLAKDLLVDTLEDYEVTKEHLERNFVIKKYIKEKREEVLETNDKAMLQVDWAENGEVLVPEEVQSSFFGGRTQYSVHTGYQYTKEDSGGFVSLSDENDHRAEAIHAALEPTIKKLAEKGFKEIIIVSDSPTSQYRNAKHAFLTKEWAQKYKLKIEWIYTEAGHGKSAADSIGGKIKNLVQDKINMDPSITIKSVQDIKAHIETTIEMNIHTKAQIKKVRDDMPKKLSSLVGALKLHNLVFESDGKIKKKILPTDPFYKAVQIKTPRTIVRRPRPEEALNEGFMEDSEAAGDDDMPEDTETQEETPPRRSIRSRRPLFTFEDIAEELDNEEEQYSESEESEDDDL